MDLQPSELSEIEAQLNQLSFDQYPTKVKDLLLAKQLNAIRRSFESYSIEEIPNLSFDKLKKLAAQLGIDYWEYQFTGGRAKLEKRVIRVLKLLDLTKDQDTKLSSIESSTFNLTTVQSATHNPFVVPNLDAIVGPKIKYLSRGGFAEVYQSEFGYAVKHFFDSELDEVTVSEVRILRYLDHPNIINPVAIQLNPLKLALPLAQSDLSKIDMSSIEVRKLIFYQIFRGLDYLHHKYVWHLDLKPQNILVFNIHGTSLVKITDFGLSQLNLRQTNILNNVVTIHWRAPEIELAETFNQSVDIWAVGVMLFNEAGPPLSNTEENLSGYHLLEKIFRLLGTPSPEDWPEFSQYPSHQGYQATVNWNDYDPEEAQVIRSCLTWPQLRKSARQILALPYFDQYRLQIETQLPTEPIELSDCFKDILTYQVPIIGNNPIYNKYRSTFIADWLWVAKRLTHSQNSTFFLSVTLLDIINDKQKISFEELDIFGIVCLWIASQCEESYPFPVSDVNRLLNNYDQEKINLTIQQIITWLHFELFIPTVWTFIIKWREPVNNLKDLRETAYKLILNQEYVKMYTPSQLAQITFEALNLKVPCLSQEPLFNSKIETYLTSVSIKNV